MAITRTLTKTFKTITRSKSSPFLRKQANEDDEDTQLTPLHPSVPPPKQLRLDLDFSDTLNLDFHQLDFSDDSKLQAWTEKNTPKLPMDESCWLGERVDSEPRDRKSVLAPESVSNGFFESPLSTPTTPSSEWGLGLQERNERFNERSDRYDRYGSVSHKSPSPKDYPPSPKSSTHSLRHKSSLTTTQYNTTPHLTTPHLSNKDKSLPKAPAQAHRPTMSQSKSCSHLPKRSKSHNSGSYISPKPTHASQFVKSRVASDVNPTHVSHANHNHVNPNHVNNPPVHPPVHHNPHPTSTHNIATYGMTHTHTTPRHMPNPSMDSFVTCTDASPQLPAHQRNMSVASVDTVSAYMDPGLASTISRYYHMEGAREHPSSAGNPNRQSREYANVNRLSQRQSRDYTNLSHRQSRDFANRQSRLSNESPFNTPSLDDRNSSSTFTMSPSTSTTMSTPSLVDSPSSCASVNVSFEKPSSQGNNNSGVHGSMPTTQPLHVTPQVPPPRPFTMYSTTDNDLVPPPRSKYRSRHYRFDSSSSSVYSSNIVVKEDYMGALRHSLYVSRDEEDSPALRPVSAFEMPQLSADDYAVVIQEGQWF